MPALSSQKPDAVKPEPQKGQSILTLLHDDHEAVKQLFTDIELASDTETRFSLVQKLVRELKLHAHAEEDVFYDRLEQEHAARRRMNESRDDHADIELQLDRLARLDGDDERLLSLVADLRADVERHVKREEDEVFAAAEAFFDGDEAEKLGQAFLARKKQLEGGAGEAEAHDDVDLENGPTVSDRPVSLQSAAELDPGFEDRGVGSDGSMPQSPAAVSKVSPAPGFARGGKSPSSGR